MITRDDEQFSKACGIALDTEEPEMADQNTCKAMAACAEGWIEADNWKRVCLWAMGCAAFWFVVAGIGLTLWRLK